MTSPSRARTCRRPEFLTECSRSRPRRRCRHIRGDAHRTLEIQLPVPGSPSGEGSSAGVELLDPIEEVVTKRFPL